MNRKDGRTPEQLRRVNLTRHFVRGVPGSCLVDFGHTRLIVTACVEERVPPWMEGRGKGWVTAEYGMLPGSTQTRKARPAAGRTDGRSVEIQRLIGRSLRQAVDLSRLGERTITVDADVVQADGGTRVAAITGGMVALHDAMSSLVSGGWLEEVPLRNLVQAVSVGMLREQPLLDLNYEEDSQADFDCNLVTADGTNIVEVSGGAEGQTLTRKQLDEMLDVALRGTEQLAAAQREALGI